LPVDPAEPNRSAHADRTADSGEDPTTVHVRCALKGDTGSLEWLVARFSPALLCHARFCLGTRLSRFYDPEDLVQETWAVALPKLPALVPSGARFTPMLVRFLSTTLVNLANRLISKHIVRRREGQATSDDDELKNLPAVTRGVITSAVRREREGHLARSIEQLPQIDRTILILRGLEDRPAKEVAVVVNLSEDAVHQRFSRTLRKIRELLPDSVFADLDAD
jgi:RNA polymerase sigma-70 factor, ECF subfamily